MHVYCTKISGQTADYYEMDSFSVELESDSHSHFEDHLTNSDGEDTISAPAEIFNWSIETQNINIHASLKNEITSTETKSFYTFCSN